MKKYIQYEMRNNKGNIMASIFGFFMPVFMTILFFNVYKGQMPENAVSGFATQMYVGNMMMIILAMTLVGFAAMFSQEVEQGVTRRLELFGYVYKKQVEAKFWGQLIIVTISSLLYSLIICILLPIKRPVIGSLIAYILSIFAVLLVLFLIAYAIAMLVGKFSVTYGITMGIYFGIMILSGMMGVTPEQFPKPVRIIAELLPTTRIIELFPDSWSTKLGNVAPLIQTFLLWYGVAGVLLFLVARKNRKG